MVDLNRLPRESRVEQVHDVVLVLMCVVVVRWRKKGLFRFYESVNGFAELREDR